MTELEKVPPVLSELSEQLTSQALKAAIYDQIVRMESLQREAKKIQDEIARLNKQLQELHDTDDKRKAVS